MSNRAKIVLFVVLLFSVIAGTLVGMGRDVKEVGPLEARPSLEHRKADGSLYTPSTQSLLRTHSRLESVNEVTVHLEDGVEKATVHLRADDEGRLLDFHNIPIRQLVPRLHYQPANPPDRMDALALMLAEYSRNGISVPWGRPGDSMAHFRTPLDGRVPWKLRGDYDFEPNPDYRPQRAAVINNCLAPGLWELSAADRSGEIYHAWFQFPENEYFQVVAEVNGLPEDFVAAALPWNEEEAPLDLERLRRRSKELGSVSIRSVDEEVSFSSQDSRRKLHKDYVLYEADGEMRSARRLSDLQNHPVWMSSFMPPGLYSSKQEERTRFDFGFLGEPVAAILYEVEPLTSYAFDLEKKAKPAQETYLELVIDFANGEKLIVGNLPTHLLVRQEDYVLHGFGVGILPASGFAERRRFLIEEGHKPSYAFLVRPEGDQLLALNSHGRGLEQVFLRSRPGAASPHFTLTLSSYERIVDLARFEIGMPAELVEAQTAHSNRYIPPIYFNYRDDNVN
jgi:hypothetical protein